MSMDIDMNMSVIVVVVDGVDLDVGDCLLEGAARTCHLTPSHSNKWYVVSVLDSHDDRGDGDVPG